MSTIKLDIVKVTINAPLRKPPMYRHAFNWRGKKMVYYKGWTLEPVRDLSIYHGLDLEEELAQLLIAEITAEQNNNV